MNPVQEWVMRGAHSADSCVCSGGGSPVDTHGIRPDFKGTCKAISIAEKIEKTFILSISGPWDLLETIPRAISDRMVRVSFIFVSSRAVSDQNKFPRALSTVSVRLEMRKGQYLSSGIDFCEA